MDQVTVGFAFLALFLGLVLVHVRTDKGESNYWSRRENGYIWITIILFFFLGISAILLNGEKIVSADSRTDLIVSSCIAGSIIIMIICYLQAAGNGTGNKYIDLPGKARKKGGKNTRAGMIISKAALLAAIPCFIYAAYIFAICLWRWLF